MINKLTEIFQKPQPATKTTYILFAIFLICALAASILARYNQLEKWKANEEIYYTSGTPMMTTLDAYKFLRHAKEYENNTFDTSKKDQMIFYPDGSPFPDPVPLLSVIINFISQKTGVDLYNTGTYLIPIISSLFIIPLALYFLFLGYPAAGLLGGTIAAFAPMFYIRTSMGRLDTDGLNLFFLFTAALFMLLASKAKTNIKIYIFSGLLGVTTLLFYMWYHHGMFNLFFLATLIICLALARVKIKNIIIASLIYLVCANPIYTFNAFGQLISAIKIYIFNVKVGAAAIFPNVYDTIGEAQKNSAIEVLSSVVTNPAIAVVGIIGCILMVIGYFRYMIPLAPIAAMGALAFVSAGRFSMFIGPIVGVGLGYLCVFLLSFVKIGSPKFNKAFKIIMPFIAVLLIAFSINSTKNSGLGLVLPPSIKAETFQVFKDMKTELPKNSAIYTWWDYGLAIADASGFPVFHSGMTQETPKTWVVAKSFISNEQTLYNIVSYLDNYGVAEIEYMAEDNKSLKDIENRIFNFDEGPANDSVFVMTTEDMVVKFSAIGYIASWTKETGAQQFPIQKLNCLQTDASTLTCGNNKINLQLGLINNNMPIKELFVTENGNIIDTRNYNFNDGYYIIIEKSGGIYLLDKKTFNTSFVQLYFLNRADPKLFKLKIDRYPYARLFQVVKKETNGPVN